MFERLGSVTYRFRFLIVAAWIGAAAWCALFGPSLAAQGMTDQTAFLPTGSSSMNAHDALEREFPGATSVTSATISFSRGGGLTDDDRGYIAATEQWLTTYAPEGLRGAVSSVESAGSRPELESMLRSDDGELEMMNVNLGVALVGGEGDVVVTGIRDHFTSGVPAGLEVHVTGAAGIGSDYLAAIIRGTDSTTIVTVVLVLVILLLIYRAPLAAMVPLATIGAAYVVARGVLGILALAGWQVSSLIDTFIVVLIFGVGTDYAIFLISRYKEELANTGDWHDASRVTVSRIGAVISASAMTVIVGLSAMAFGDFGMIQTTGPALAVAVLVTLVAGLTLSPALLAIFGHYLFWPLHMRNEPEGEPRGVFARLAAAVSRRPGIVTFVLLVALAIPAVQIGQMRTNFDVLAELPADSDARQGYDQIADHLGKGNVFQASGIVDGGAATDVLAPATLADLRDLVQDIGATPGVKTVTSLVTPESDGVVPDAFQPSRQLAEMARGFEDDDGTAGDSEALADPEVTDGLDTAIAYVAGLGEAFPDVRAGAAYRAVADGLADARGYVDRARENAVVSTQLRTLSEAMTSTTAAAGGDGDDSIGMIGDYLDELAAAWPEASWLAAFDDATTAVASLEEDLTISAALDLSDALGRLADHFEDRPEVTLYPDSLARTSEARRLAREVQATFDALPADLDALGGAFAGRPDDLYLPTGLGGEAGEGLDQAIDAFVSGDGSATRFYIALVDDPYADTAFRTVRDVQTTLTAAAPDFGSDAGAYLGGTTAQYADVQQVLARDFERVGVITVVGILVILMLLLRAVIAPLYLVGTVLLSCATALGLSAWFFESVLGQPGVSFYLPILVFVLLVALGSDYNIFLMSRVREESEGRPIHEGIRIASGRTGAVITSAGLILAGTFGSMATAPLVVLVQVGLTVAVGVLIDTFVVRSILVPAITTLADERAWWPAGFVASLSRRGWPVVVSIPETGALAAVTDGGATANGAPEPPASRRSWRRLGVVLAMVALVPMAVGGLFVWSLASPTEHLDAVTAAVVELDEGATVTGTDGTAEWRDLGADLATRLAAGEADGGAGAGATFHWVVADASDAADGLATGRYGAVLTIPADFSARIASIRADATAGAGQATLRLETNDATSYALGSIARSVSGAIVTSTAETVTQSYVDDVLVAVNAARQRLDGAATAVDTLGTDITDLAGGAGGVSTVAGEFLGGLEELADGMTSATDGAARLADGIIDLADGVDLVADGVAGLRTGARSAARGSDAVADGAEALADGLDTLAAGTASLPARAGALSAGAADVADGVTGVAGGARALADSLAQMRAGTTGLGDQAAALDAGAGALAAGLDTYHDGARQAANGAEDFAAGAGAYAGSIADYTGGVAALAAGCAALGGGDAVCGQLAAIAAQGDALDAGASGLASGADQVAGSVRQLAHGSRDLAAAAAQVADGTGRLAGSAPALEAGIAAAAGGSDSLADGAEDLASGAHQLAAGTATLGASLPALSQAIADSADGADKLATGSRKLAGGLSELASGTAKLATGARTAADGAAAVADGTSELTNGSSLLADGLTEATDAARLVETQAAALDEDGQAVAADASRLANALADEAGAMPEWSEAAREEAGAVVANPVAVETARINAVATTGDGLAPYFMALALWIGAMVLFLVLPAAAGSAGGPGWWRRPLVAFGAAAIVALVQALLLVAVMAVLGVAIARPAELVAFAALAALAFTAVVQALVALWGFRGWFAALFLAVLQLTSAGAVYPVETAPALFQLLHPLLPMTYAIEAFRTLLAGGGPSVAPAAVVLLLWLAGGLAVSLAVAWQRGRQRAAPEVLAPA